jgi:glycosyltransferase domain-containing protein
MISIIIPIRSPMYYRRVLEFLSNQTGDWKIYILDSSAQQDPSIVQHCIEKNVCYRRCPIDESLYDLFKKISLCLEEVGTAYVHIASDDDFFDAHEISSACDYLDSNLDVVAYYGKTVDFSIYKNLLGRDLFLIETNAINSSGRYKTIDSVSQMEPSDRLKYGLEKTWPWEGVYRIEVLRDIFNFLVNRRVDNFYAMLISMRIITLLRGKTFVSFQLLTLRQDNTRESAGSAIRPFLVSRCDLRSLVSDLISLDKHYDVSCSQQEMEKLVDQIYKGLSKVIPPTFAGRNLLKMGQFIRRIKIVIYIIISSAIGNQIIIERCHFSTMNVMFRVRELLSLTIDRSRT